MFLEVLPIVLETEKETLLLLIMYHMPGPLGSFIDDFFYWLMNCQNNTDVNYWSNLDQILPEYVAKVDPLIQNFNLSQHSQYSTHIHGRILDLVFHIPNSNIVSSLLWPCSGCFVLFFEIWCFLFIQNLAGNNLAFNPHYITQIILLISWWKG